MKIIKLYEMLLNESKADQQKLVDFVGNQYADLFFKLKDRMKSPQNDIYYWLKKSPEELIDFIDSLQNIKSGNQQRKENDEIAHKGAELVYSDENWKVYHITTYEASVKYGKNAQWCISGSKCWSSGVEEGRKYWDDYAENDYKFYFYLKSDGTKYAVAYRDGDYSIWNQEDDEISNILDAPIIDELPEEVSSKGLSKYFELTDNGKTLIIKNKTKIINQHVSGAIEGINIDKIIISDGIEEIGDYTFYRWMSPTSISIPNSVTEIGVSAFEKCTSLESVTIPDSVEIIGWDAFEDCVSLESVNIGRGVTEIRGYAFCGCTSLTSVTIPDSVENIGKFAFSASLKEVHIKNPHTKIEHNAFPRSTKIIYD